MVTGGTKEKQQRVLECMNKLTQGTLSVFNGTAKKEDIWVEAFSV